MSWGEATRFAAPPAATQQRPLDLYAIVDSAERVHQVLAAGVLTVQLRIKAPAEPNAAWQLRLSGEIGRSIAACRAAGAELFINDHWQLAQALGASGVHLGQEDLLALGETGRAALQASGLAIGISSHSLWELCRARNLPPRYIACGPVWPTLTKAMPWRAQGLDNLAWWRHMAPAPVVAIGGILSATEVRQAAGCGVDGVCVVRGLGADPSHTVRELWQALRAGRAGAESSRPPTLPHASLAR
jgi:hydroxymethylpyrimidine kinase/phosphomethylpyrimidine kinase/thiamine-phosphate diphosphorylase